MAIVDLTPTVLSTAGSDQDFASGLSASDTYRVRNPGNVVLHFTNTSGSQRTVTVDVPATVAGQSVPDFTYAIPATTGDIWVQPLPPGVVNDDAGNIVFSIDNADGVSVCPIQVS